MNKPIRDIIRQHARPLEPLPTGQPTVLQPLRGIRAVLFDIYGTLFISGSGDIGASDTEFGFRNWKHEQIKEDDHIIAECSVAAEEVDLDRWEYEESVLYPRIINEAFAAAGITDRLSRFHAVSVLTNTIIKVHNEMHEVGISYPEVNIVGVWRTVIESLRADGSLRCHQPTNDQLKIIAARYEVSTNAVWPMPGAEDCIRRIEGAGLMLGIISNAQFYTPELFPALMNEDLTELGFDERLRFYSYEHRCAKPGTELYSAALKELEAEGISAEETLFVGNDMLNDITAASKVGFRTALFAGDARSLRLREGDSRVGGVVPDLVIDHLGQLPDCLLSND